MKPFLILSFLFLVITANAKNYYISATGNDTNNGLSPATAWQTIAKLNSSFASILAGDSILFKKGDIFSGTIIVKKSGTSSQPIIFAAYGSGEKPLISGFLNATGWVNAGANLWQSAALNCSNKPNMVTINNTPTPMGRYPNYGYMTFENSVGNSTIIDNELTNSPNWTGAELVIRKNHWIISRDIITNHTGNNITYAGVSGFNSINGYGYFIQNSLSTLDTLNEWYFNSSTKKITVYAVNAPTNVKVSGSDTLLFIGANNNIIVDEIAFEGANVATIFIGTAGGQAANNIIKNCDINFSGRDGIYGTYNNNCTIDKCTINNSFNNGINLENEGGKSLNVTITNNTIKNSGTKPGMGYLNALTGYNMSYCGIAVMGDNSLIQYNTVDTSGYVGILYYYDNSKVLYNRVNYYCIVKDDGAGIYTHTGYDGSLKYTGRKVIGNTISNGIGAGIGTLDGTNAAQGIYLDDGTTGVLVDSNTVFNTSYSGIYVHNSQNITVTNNLVYDCNVTQLLIVHDPASPNSPIRNLILQNNKFVAKSNNSYAVIIKTIRNDIDSFNLTPGSFKNNYYCRPANENLTINVTKNVSGVTIVNDYTLATWKAAYPAYDINSHISPLTLPAYQINNLDSTNAVFNKFISNMEGIISWSQTNNVVASWDNTGKITGSGSYKITPKTSKPDFAVIYSNSGGIGSVSAAKNYILRVTTLGTANGILKAYLRQYAAPYTLLVQKQSSDFGVSKKVHEFLFSAPTTESLANFVIEIQETSGVTFIDDIEFYEATVTSTNPDNYIRFEYNSTNAAKTISLGSKYIEIDSTVYNGSITLKPFTSVVLLKSGVLSSNLTADAGTDVSLILPINNTLLKGTASGTVTSYSWTKIAGPAQFTIASPNNPSTAINNLAMGKYTFQLKVMNNAGDSALATVNVVMLGILPVTLIDFSAKNNNEKIALQWKVASEINVSHYSIERSGNSHSFENIGQVSANNLFAANYNFDDNFPLQGINYYRLVMIDIDGTTKYSKIISVSANNISSFKLNKLLLSATYNTLKIGVHSNYQQQMQVVLADVSGRILYTNTIMLQKGFNDIDKKITALNTGVYYARLFTSDQVITKTLLSGQ